MSRCSCGQPAAYEPSSYNGSRRGLCSGCFEDLPASRRHLWEAASAWAEAGHGMWHGYDP